MKGEGLACYLSMLLYIRIFFYQPMKYSLLSAFLGILSFTSVQSSFAQVQDLIDMMEGKLLNSLYINDENDELWGYFFLYDLGKVEEDVHEMKYYVMNTDLELLASNSWTEKFRGRARPNVREVVKINKELIINGTMDFFSSTYRQHIPRLSTQRVIDLEKNVAGPKYLAENGKWRKYDISLDDFIEHYYRPTGMMSIRTIPWRGSYVNIAVASSMDKLLHDVNSISAYSADYSMLWMLEIPDDFQEDRLSLSQVIFNENSMACVFLAYPQSKQYGAPRGSRLINIDLETGELNYSKDLGGQKGSKLHRFDIDFQGEDLELVGLYARFNKYAYSEVNKREGIFKKVYDKDGKLKADKYIPWMNLSGFIGIDEKGKIGRNFFLHDVFHKTIKGGKTIFVLEKATHYPGGVDVRSPVQRIKDLVAVIFDDQFNVETVEVFEKYVRTADKGDDLMFWETNKDDTSVDFYFKKRIATRGRKNESWELWINKFDGDNIVSERIDLNSGDRTITPLRAKSGYILLHEYSEDNSYNQFRLEKLNR